MNTKKSRSEFRKLSALNHYENEFYKFSALKLNPKEYPILQNCFYAGLNVISAEKRIIDYRDQQQDCDEIIYRCVEAEDEN